MKSIVVMGAPLAIVLTLWLAPIMAPYAPDVFDLPNAFALPSQAHWLGAADNGVDILSIVLYGARTTITIAVLATLLAACVGVVLGMVTGATAWRWVDETVLFLADGFQTFPSLVLSIALVAWVKHPTMFHVVLALALPGWVVIMRVTRAQVLSLRSRDFILAAEVLGLSRGRRWIKHMLPSVLPVVWVQITLGMGNAVLGEATLAFLGLGPSTLGGGAHSVSVSWGSLLEQGTQVLLVYPHVLLVGGCVLTATVFVFNMLGEWLQSSLVVSHRALG